VSLVGASWGSVVCALMAQLLEADNVAVSLTLLESVPGAVQEWAGSLLQYGNVNSKLVSHYFQTDNTVTRAVGRATPVRPARSKTALRTGNCPGGQSAGVGWRMARRAARGAVVQRRRVAGQRGEGPERDAHPAERRVRGQAVSEQDSRQGESGRQERQRGPCEQPRHDGRK